MSTLASGLVAALKIKGVTSICLVTDGPPAVLLDGREWKVHAESKDAENWKTSPYFPQGKIPEGGIDGYVKKIAENGDVKDVPLHSAYFPMPDAPWGKKLLEELAKMSGGSAEEIK